MRTIRPSKALLFAVTAIAVPVTVASLVAGQSHSTSQEAEAPPEITGSLGGPAGEWRRELAAVELAFRASLPADVSDPVE